MVSPLTRWFHLPVCTGYETLTLLFTINWLWPQSETQALDTGGKRQAKT